MKPYYEHAGITIYHGDCREVLPNLPKFDLILTDPPYGVGLDYGANSSDEPSSYWEWFLPIIYTMQYSAESVVFTHRQAALKEIHGYSKIAIWDKPMSFGYSIGNWLCHWEPVFIFGKLGKPSPDVFHFNTEPPNGHPAPKPEGLMKSIISLWEGSICDPFCGSGTTLRAAKNLGRTAIGIEIEEKYCEIAAKRLSQEVFNFSEAGERVGGSRE